MLTKDVYCSVVNYFSRYVSSGIKFIWWVQHNSRKQMNRMKILMRWESPDIGTVCHKISETGTYIWSCWRMSIACKGTVLRTGSLLSWCVYDIPLIWQHLIYQPQYKLTPQWVHSHMHYKHDFYVAYIKCTSIIRNWKCCDGDTTPTTTRSFEMPYRIRTQYSTCALISLQRKPLLQRN